MATKDSEELSQELSRAEWVISRVVASLGLSGLAETSTVALHQEWHCRTEALVAPLSVWRWYSSIRPESPRKQFGPVQVCNLYAESRAARA